MENLNTDYENFSKAILLFFQENENVSGLKAVGEVGTTLLVNGKYGSGKTFFLRWFIQNTQANLNKKIITKVNKAGFLSSEHTFSDDVLNYDIKLISIDMSKYDYFRDPFRSIIDQLLFECGATEDEKLAVAMAVSNIFSSIGGILSLSHPGMAIPLKLLKKLLSEKKDKSEDLNLKIAIENLKKILANLGCSDGRICKKIILIDELDRCRPSFVIDCLECIKHLFSVSNTAFVILADKSQLKRVVNSQFGKIDSSEYLSKFYDMTFELPVSESFLITLLDYRLSDLNCNHHFKKLAHELLKHYRLSPRNISKFTLALKFVLKIYSTPNYAVIILLFFRLFEEKIYDYLLNEFVNGVLLNKDESLNQIFLNFIKKVCPYYKESHIILQEAVSYLFIFFMSSKSQTKELLESVILRDGFLGSEAYKNSLLHYNACFNFIGNHFSYDENVYFNVLGSISNFC